ncbi:hypothetical protein GJ496_005915 [Pomphorhynchus laevis]|nr:hypothetical protein GJ496_005915 [Pomphorhynchus laevis]
MDLIGSNFLSYLSEKDGKTLSFDNLAFKNQHEWPISNNNSVLSGMIEPITVQIKCCHHKKYSGVRTSIFKPFSMRGRICVMGDIASECNGIYFIAYCQSIKLENNANINGTLVVDKSLKLLDYQFKDDIK